MKTSKPWDWKPVDSLKKAALKSAKDKILAFHLQRHEHNCCYCRTGLMGSGPFMTDREHVLPKGKASFRAFSFAIWNLGVACKRCNMQFKGSGTGFIVDKDDPASFQASGNYLFIHPNFDRWADHLTRFDGGMNEKKVVFFSNPTNSAKGEYTKAFFALGQLARNSFARGQGQNTPEQFSRAAALVEELAIVLGQPVP
ncbi:hypothetical protein B5K08_31105 [Rhizobium leguminosarum bv. trifolii]|uniref:HNH endonuclease n=1 Tax=Rhizobium leguminosarum bv. trifolii TaxID=386 RepID=A0A3E1AZ95_RHILT|nr:hypothetical protein B5K10_31100 [Rhizobium leguminosarum bv. trifolii]RFB82995.1 hypothetical protein B5K08_31105 [Rhizobium leguminosarum bv. trifolii]